MVVAGTATVVNNDRIFKLSTNESTFIQVGAIHMLENNESDNLIIIEVQIGINLSEDDIVRYKDIYRRKVSNI